MVERRIVRHARKLITRRANWTRFVAAKDQHGGEGDFLSAAAVRFCAEGAVCRAAYDVTGAKGSRLINIALGILWRLDASADLPDRWWSGLSEINDYKKRGAHAAVLRVLDEYLAGRRQRSSGLAREVEHIFAAAANAEEHGRAAQRLESRH